jgi:hypothetical protein
MEAPTKFASCTMEEAENSPGDNAASGIKPFSPDNSVTDSTNPSKADERIPFLVCLHCVLRSGARRWRASLLTLVGVVVEEGRALRRAWPRSLAADGGSGIGVRGK